ncbi:DUF5804 family protein [Halapricum hydrolyticum]|uniref:DUF5804 family protein n=1 Tax=Halapricum hydrolyticum TaxID=2979991 RepID=A0AAE3IDY7_9EURY|nr:DUF5804 family protein [Halapricum hydrolyticum]MCU4719170.1 DUF5804 family protein [Halapricum hydrolyticum]MCU4728261.1 DUF5804 family protein [Halapricum hydrolyticum]
MTRVCLLGGENVNLEYELLSHETSRNALATYDLREPYDNAVALETVSLGSAVALLNDLNWYLVRFVSEALVLEPSVSDSEWLSRDVATAVRDDDLAPAETDRFLKIYGVVEPGANEADEQSDPGEGGADIETKQDRPPRLVEPMFVTRTGPDLPEYDLRDVEETVVVRVTESEFGA